MRCANRCAPSCACSESRWTLFRIERTLRRTPVAETKIKEGKQAVKMTRLSCHRFRSNQVRLALSLLASTCWVCREGLRTGRSPACSNDCKDRRAAGQTCTLLLAFPGGRASDAAAVRGDAEPDRAATDTDGISGSWSSQSVAESLYKLVGGGRGVAKVGHKWGNFGLYWCGWKTVGSSSIERSFHDVANGRDGCTMVLFSRSKRKFR